MYIENITLYNRVVDKYKHVWQTHHVGEVYQILGAAFVAGGGALFHALLKQKNIQISTVM